MSCPATPDAYYASTDPPAGDTADLRFYFPRGFDPFETAQRLGLALVQEDWQVDGRFADAARDRLQDWEERSRLALCRVREARQGGDLDAATADRANRLINEAYR